MAEEYLSPQDAIALLEKPGDAEEIMSSEESLKLLEEPEPEENLSEIAKKDLEVSEKKGIPYSDAAGLRLIREKSRFVDVYNKRIGELLAPYSKRYRFQGPFFETAVGAEPPRGPTEIVPEDIREEKRIFDEASAKAFEFAYNVTKPSEEAMKISLGEIAGRKRLGAQAREGFEPVSEVISQALFLEPTRGVTEHVAELSRGNITAENAPTLIGLAGLFSTGAGVPLRAAALEKAELAAQKAATAAQKIAAESKYVDELVGGTVRRELESAIPTIERGPGPAVLPTEAFEESKYGAMLRDQLVRRSNEYPKAVETLDYWKRVSPELTKQYATARGLNPVNALDEMAAAKKAGIPPDLSVIAPPSPKTVYEEMASALPSAKRPDPRKYVDSVVDQIRSQGKTAETLADDIQKSLGEITIGEAENQKFIGSLNKEIENQFGFPAISKTKIKESWNNVKAASEGYSIPLTDAEKSVYAQLRKRFDEAIKEAGGVFTEKELGYIKNYFPAEMLFKDVASPSGKAQIVKNLKKAGFSESRINQAYEDIVEIYAVRENSPILLIGKKGAIIAPEQSMLRRAGHIELRRELTPEEIYVLDKAGLIEENPVKTVLHYLDSWTKRKTLATNFGIKNEKLDEYLGAVAKEGGNREFIQDAWNSVLFPANYDKEKGVLDFMVRAANTAVVIPLLTLSSLSQLTALPVAAAQTRKGAFVKSIGDMLKLGKLGSYVDDSIASGALRNDILKNVMGSIRQSAYSGIPGKTLNLGNWLNRKYLKLNLMEYIDKATRVFGTRVGRHMYPTLLDAERKFQKGIMPIEEYKSVWKNIIDEYAPEIRQAVKVGREPSTNEMYASMKRWADNIAAKVSPEQYPLKLSQWNPTFRETMMFLRGTAYQQFIKLHKTVFRPALLYAMTGGKQGELKPFMKYVSFSMPLGAGITAIKDLAYSKKVNDRTLFGWMVASAINAQMAGIAGDLIFRSLIKTTKSGTEGRDISGVFPEMVSGVERYFVPASLSAGIGVIRGYTPVQRIFKGRKKERSEMTPSEIQADELEKRRDRILKAIEKARRRG